MNAPISRIRSATGVSGIITGAWSAGVGLLWWTAMGASHSAPFHDAFMVVDAGYLLASLALVATSIAVLATHRPMPPRIAVGASAVQLVLWIIILVIFVIQGWDVGIWSVPVVWSAIPFGCAVRCVAVDRRARAAG